MPHIRVEHLPTIRNIPDEFWDEIKLSLPSEKANNTIGRPIIPFRKVVDGIFYVLRTGCQWKALPRSLGASSTVHDRFQDWRKEGVFRRMWIDGLSAYNENTTIDWKWQAMDGVITKTPLGEKIQAQILQAELNMVQNVAFL